MRELDGFGVVQALDVTLKPSIVFVTAHSAIHRDDCHPVVRDR
jgi:DNA-binding LytR/AlgR family response regulator